MNGDPEPSISGRIIIAWNIAYLVGNRARDVVFERLAVALGCKPAVDAGEQRSHRRGVVGLK